MAGKAALEAKPAAYVARAKPAGKAKTSAEQMLATLEVLNGRNIPDLVKVNLLNAWRAGQF